MDFKQIFDSLAGSLGEGLRFEPMQFVYHLQYLFTGMISIFLVMGVIVLVTVLLNKVFSDDKKKGE